MERTSVWNSRKLGISPKKKSWLAIFTSTFLPWVQNREANTDLISEGAVKMTDENCNGKVKQY